MQARGGGAWTVPAFLANAVSAMHSTIPQYRIVRGRQGRRLPWRLLLVLGWLASLALVAAAVLWLTRPAGLDQLRQRAASAEAAERQSSREVAELRRRMVVLEQSDRISRAANLDLQDTLAQRETQINDLRSDLAFYARLAGPTAQRTDLTVFSSRFAAQGDGAFGYRIVLTQTLDRDAISTGQMQLAVDGVRAGRHETLGWAQLHTGGETVPQAFSFRYFQELSGRIVLPAGFTPQRVRVTLQAPGRAPVERAFDWAPARG